ncbi:hypothetical protein K438DRAFT_1877054 [Mycena galopus ATCC 62051]|nr:hypothetical protein K438DRAFT_1877054 [Mycena galopus ATCC 62051]
METPHVECHQPHALGPFFRPIAFLGKPAKVHSPPGIRVPCQSPTRTHKHTRTIPIPRLTRSSNSSSGGSRRTYGARLSPPIPLLAFANSCAQQNGEEYALVSCARQAPSSAHDVSRPPLAPSPLPSHPTMATCPRTASASPRRNNHHHRARLHTARTPAAIRAAAAAVPTTTAGSPHQLHGLPPYLRSRLHPHPHSSAACSPTKSRHWFRGCGAFGSGPRSPKPSPESWGKRGKLTATAASSGSRVTHSRPDW